MKMHLKQIASALVFALGMMLSQPAFAIKANPRAITVRQPDGTTLVLRIHGDENHHYLATTDGYRVATDKAGFYRYVEFDAAANKLRLTDLRVHDFEGRDAAEQTRVSKMKKAHLIEQEWKGRNPLTPKMIEHPLSPTVVNPSAYSWTPSSNLHRVSRAAEANESQYLCILVNFADNKMKFKNEHFNNFLNQKNYDGYGSVKDYFRDNSGGKFVPNFQVVGPYTLPEPQSFYADNSYDTGSDIDPRGMVIHALRLTREKNPELNFKQFDNDGDGYMDNVYVIYAGYSEASTGNAADMWPHSWTLGNDTINYDGVIIKNYSCSQELVGSPEANPTPSMDGIGTFTHEFGHVLGLMDMYDTNDYYDGMGLDPGAYSLYASGSYNNDSKTPAALWAFERLQMGWMKEGEDIKELKAGEDVTQPNSAETFTARYIDCHPKEKGQEWFILENRQFTGWDEFIPSHGLLIYHYDYTEPMVTKYWSLNSPNNNARHRCLYIIPADNVDDTNSRSGDTFPGSSGNIEFTDFTTPNALNWAGEQTNVPITNIQERDGIIYYQAAGGSSVWDVIKTLRPTHILDTQITVSGQVVNHQSAIKEVGFCWAEGRTEPTVDGQHKSVSVTDSPVFTITGLKPGTAYTYKAYMTLADGSVVYGSPMNVKTEYETAYAPFVEDFTSWTNNLIDGWEIVDNNSDGVTWVYDKQAKAICYQFDYWNNADDWLIGKRRYHIPENGYLYFKRGVNEQQYMEGLEVYVSTTSSNLQDFYLHKQFSIADNFGREVYEEVDLSMYAGQDIYIALRCNSERSQGLLRLWDVRLEQKLDTPQITYFGKGDGDDQLKIKWTDVSGADKYYFFLGRVTEDPYTTVLFTTMDFYEHASQNIDFGTGHIFFRSTGSVELKTIDTYYEDLRFMLYPTGPTGVSYLEVEGTKDGTKWEPVCPRISVSAYNSEGVECNYTDYVKGKQYIKLRFRFTNNGRLCHLRYLTVGYNDGYYWDQLAAGYVQGTEKVVDAKTAGEFNKGQYVTWVASGTSYNLFFDQSQNVFYPQTSSAGSETTSIAQPMPDGYGQDMIYSPNGIRRQQLQPGINIVRKPNGKSYVIYK